MVRPPVAVACSETAGKAGRSTAPDRRRPRDVAMHTHWFAPPSAAAQSAACFPFRHTLNQPKSLTNPSSGTRGSRSPAQPPCWAAVLGVGVPVSTSAGFIGCVRTRANSRTTIWVAFDEAVACVESGRGRGRGARAQ